MFAWQLFNLFNINSTFVGSTQACISSTYRFQLQRYNFSAGIRSSSSDVMKIFASKGPNGEPIATPSYCIQILLLKVRYNYLVQRYSNFFKTVLGMFVSNFFSSYTFFTSKEIIFYPAGIVSSLSLLIKSSVFKML